MAFRLTGMTLSMAATVRNTGNAALPFSFGFHPAFAWPLPGAASRAGHALHFQHPDPARIGRLPNDSFASAVEPSPVQGTTLPLADALFAAGAMVLEAPASRSLRYTAPGARALQLAWQGLPQLGLWTRAGGDFLCVEPWHGYHSPPGWDGAFSDKPGLALLPPGASQVFAMTIRPE
jgi:galactose mutarotase-like enzyme